MLVIPKLVKKTHQFMSNQYDDYGLIKQERNKTRKATSLTKINN